MAKEDDPLEIFDSCVDRKSSIRKYCSGLIGKKKDKCSQNIDKAIAKGLENTIKRCVTDKTDKIQRDIASGEMVRLSPEEAKKRGLPEERLFKGKTVRDKMEF